MALSGISSAWRANREVFPTGNNQDRFLIDFRQQIYPPLSTGADPTAHNLAYWPVTSAGINGAGNAMGVYHAAVFGAATNLVTNPELVTTADGWTAANCTAVIADVYYRAQRFSKITCSGVATAYVSRDVETTTATPTFSAKICKGTGNGISSLRFTDNTTSTIRGSIYITWTTSAVALANGATHLFYEWIDSNTVWVSANAAGCINENDNEIRFYPEHTEAENEYAYVTAIMVADKTYAYPYTATSSSAAAPNFLLPMPTSGKFTLRLVVLPFFVYDTVIHHKFWEWYIDTTHRLIFYYNTTTDAIYVTWIDGGNARNLISTQFDDGSSYTNINQWLIIDAAIDLTTGTTAGSQLWINRVSKDTTWSGNIDAKTSYFPVASLGHEAGAAQADSLFSYAILIPDYVATNADVQNDYKDIKQEQIWWLFNGEGCGRTYCDITRFVLAASGESQRENSNGSQCANSLSLTLKSIEGEFADDQYAAFDPTTDTFNGTSSQKYMQSRCPVMAQSWYSGSFEPYFIGRLDEAMFSRVSPVDGITTVTVNAEDAVSEIARARQQVSVAYSDDKLSDATETDSLIHQIARLATKKQVINYLANSSFENDTIENSWIVSGADAALTRETGGLFGTYAGQLVYGSADAYVWQYTTFTGTKRLNVGETYTFSIYLKSASTCGSTIYLSENDSGGEHARTFTNWILTGGAGWKMFEASHTVTDSTSDRLRCVVKLDDNVTLLMDGAMLTQTARAPLWFVLNNNDGAAGVESADDADSAGYDTVGFDVDYVSIVHPYAVIDYGESPWEHLKDLANATAARYLGIDPCGCLRYRTPFATGYEDPTSLLTVDSGSSIESQLLPVSVNKLVVHGNNIVKSTEINLLWTIRDSRLWTEEMEGIELSDGEYWPDRTLVGPFWADYQDIILPKIPESVRDLIRRWP